MARKKQDWRIYFDQNMEQEFKSFKAWYHNQFRQEPSKSDFVKFSLDMFSQNKKKIKRKPRSKNIKCL